MDKEQIIQWAREAAGLKCNCCTPYFEEDDIDGFEAFLEAFAKLVADAEAKRISDEGMVTVGHMREQVAKERDRVIKAATKLADFDALFVDIEAKLREKNGGAV
jgi:hypothetical protein